MMSMMRRFSRRRRAGGDGGARAIDTGAWMTKLIEQEAVGASSLEPWSEAGTPESLAAIGRGEDREGQALIVAFSPHSAIDATLAGLAAAQRATGVSEFKGRLMIAAPEWSAAARRLLSQIGETPYRVEPLALPMLAPAALGFESDAEPQWLAIHADQLAARLVTSQARSAFRRAALALEGLAAKHGGSVRVGADRLELVVMARRVAEIRIEDDQVVLETQVGGRSTTPLAAADLAGAFDGLEGQLRRRLNDRKVREGEEGLRGRVVGQLATGTELRGLRAWPQPGQEVDVVDAVGVNAEGDPVVVVVRQELDWIALAAALASLAPVAALCPTLFAGLAPPLRLGSPRLLLLAERFVDGLESVLAALTLPFELRTVAGAAGPAVDLVPRSRGDGAEARGPRRGRRRGGRGLDGRGADRESASPEAEERDSEDDAQASPAAEARGGRRRGGEREATARDESPPRGPRSEEGADNEEPGRRRGRRRRSRGGRSLGNGEATESEGSGREGRASEEAARGDGGRRSRGRFEEVSLMDLDEGPGGSGEDTSARNDRDGDGDAEGSRRRRRRRGRRGGTSTGGDRDERPPRAGTGDEGAGPESDGGGRVEEDDLVDSDDLEEILARLAGDVQEFDASEGEELGYEDEDDELDDDAAHEKRRDLEKRRRARQGGQDADRDADRPAPRRRSVVLVHADRDSLFAALLLARDIRQLDGLWVYPQSELMTFFRSVATDLRDDTPIFVVGFQPSPARDVIQASSLYRGRLTWFDRRAWPPEDLMALRQSLGREAVHGGEDIDSVLPLVLETCTRRSRFSDKLVDLATGRFTQHDFERWGRLWWWRLGEIAKKTGDIRAEVASLLTGRPSDLTKEAARLEVPPPPEEVAYVAERDFRLVHFGGYVLVVVPVEGEADVHLVARIARERYDASLSLAYRVGEETLSFCGDEQSGRRTLDYLAVAAHLVDKLEWVEMRPDADHVARFRIRDLERQPERLEELIGEIAMGRSLLER
jgi:hypothetical protein